MARGLQPPPLREAHRLDATDDEVVERADVHERERVLEPLRQPAVRVRGLSDSAWMIVGEDHRCCIVVQRLLHDFARMDTRAIERAAEQLLERDHAMTAVEIEYAEDFVWAIREPGDEPALDGGGVRERLAALNPLA